MGTWKKNRVQARPINTNEQLQQLLARHSMATINTGLDLQRFCSIITQFALAHSIGGFRYIASHPLPVRPSRLHA